MASLQDFFHTMLLIVITIAVISLLCALALYILRSIGLYTLAKNRGLSSPGMAWIPAVWLYTLGEIHDDIHLRQGSPANFRLYLLCGGILRFLQPVASVALVFFSFGELFWSLLDGVVYDKWSGFGGIPGMYAINIVSSAGSLIAIAVHVLSVIALYHIYKVYSPQNAVVWTVLCAVIPLLQSIFPFVIRNALPQETAPLAPKSSFLPPIPPHPPGPYQPPGESAAPPPFWTEPCADPSDPPPPPGEGNNL